MINLYYDDILHGNGWSAEDNPVAPYKTITGHLNKLKIPYSEHKIDFSTVIDENAVNIYVIELMRCDKISDIFLNVSELAYQLLRNNVKLLIYFPIEGFDLSLYDNWFYKLHQCFKNFDITCKKYFVFNNLVIDELYENFLKTHSVQEEHKFEKVFGFSFFQFEYYHTVMSHIENKVPQVNIENIFFKEKDFLSLNSKIRAHRLLLVSELKRRNLVQNNFVSMIGNTFDHPDTTIDFAKQTLLKHFKANTWMSPAISEHAMHYLDNFTEIVLDVDAKNLNDRMLDPSYYEKSYFSLITETGMGHYLRITEKPYRAIVNYHPFIIIGCHGTLRHLKTLGFETFPEFFDESYDDETDSLKRLLMVIDQVEKFCALPESEKKYLYTKVHHKVLHNKELFFTTISNKVELEFKSIFKEICNG